jgi:DNA-binding transcriptional ArsR family regulator
MAVGELQSHLDIPGSTLSHHILFLVTAGLIRQQRQGRILQCMPDFDRMRAIVAALTAECCTGLPVRKEAKRPREGAKRPRGERRVAVRTSSAAGA